MIGQTQIREIREHAGAGPVLVGVSGGRDSIALLHALREGGLENLVAVCVNHGLRGSESDAEARFVREFCAELGVEFRGCRANVAREARGRGIELAARDARYRWFGYWMRRLGSRTLALGHHLDDQAETVLFNLLRGAGGLRGMARVTPGPAGGLVFRPLLDARRDEISRYLQTRGLAWRDDSSNFQAEIAARNALRLDALPGLSAIMRRDVAPLIARAAGIERDSRIALGQAIAALRPLDPQGRLHVGRLLEFPPELRREAVFRTLTGDWKLSGIGAAQVDLVMSLLPSHAGGELPDRASVNLPGGVRVRRRQGRVLVEAVSQEEGAAGPANPG